MDSTTTTNDSSTQPIQVPDEFKKIIVDMTKDILVSFPEQETTLNQYLRTLVFEQDDTNAIEHALKYLFIFCKTKYPVNFFDILYQNEDIFKKDDVEFLPGINFKLLWSENITDKTRETLWKYLQLVLFTVVTNISDGNTFGDTAKLFEAINEDEFKSKIEETILNMQSLFSDDSETTHNEGQTNERGKDGEVNNDSDDDSEDDSEDANNKTKTNNASKKESEGINLEDLPNPSDIHEHVTSMMNGKLGKLAREIAEETASDLNIDNENAGSINDVFKRLIQNPTKLMGLVKSVGSKLDTKIKEGDMKESELLQEASEMMKKMKDMPGMGNIQSMLSKMGMNPSMASSMGGKGGGKMNVSAMQANIERNLKNAKNKERLLQKLSEKKAAAASAAAAEAVSAYNNKNNNSSQTTPGFENLVFSKGEDVERSKRQTQSQTQSQSEGGEQPNKSNNAKKKKKKNKKN